MKQTHPDHRTLEGFLHCVLEEPDAVAVAVHIDDCPACAAWVSAHDPLASAFASVEDPPLPPNLVAAALAASGRAKGPGPEPLIAAFLLGAAATLLLVGGGPARALSGAGVVLGALGTAAEALIGQAGVTLLIGWVGLAAAVLMVAGMTVRQLELRRLT